MKNKIIIDRKQALFNVKADKCLIAVLSFTLGLIVANLI